MSKSDLHFQLVKFCQEKNYKLIQEYKFNTDRRWKADYFIPEMNLLIEYEGLGGNTRSGNGGHQTKSGYTSNCEKYNSACLLGYDLLRYTALNTNQLVNDLHKLK
jgi:hypothetical protein